MQAFAELPVVIIRAAIVVVINQSLTLPDTCIKIYAEYLARAIHVCCESVGAFSAKASIMNSEYVVSRTIEILERR